MRFCVCTDMEPPKRGRKGGDVKNGNKTLRFKADGQTSIEETDDIMDKAIERINGLLETYMGINDSELGKFEHEEKKRTRLAFIFFSSSTNLGVSTR